MTPTTKKTAAEAATSTTAQESLPKTSLLAYMGRTSWDYDPEMDDPA
ncbi:MAG: hypothetical protein L0L74_03650 [Corynebacterium casei]|nr:hypothetical protein [Corynebacterium casei]